jgi:membrane-associated protease RseP (regulator of RpoE activity)
MEQEVRSKDGRYYIVRVMPYRTTEDRIEGAVMTFFDITARRAAERALRDVEEGTSADAYWRAATWKRVAVIAAGPLANVLVAFVILFVVFAFSGSPSGRPTAEVAEVDAARLVAGNAKAVGWSAPRPARSALASVRGWPMPSLEDAVARYVNVQRFHDSSDRRFAKGGT